MVGFPWGDYIFARVQLTGANLAGGHELTKEGEITLGVHCLGCWSEAESASFVAFPPPRC